jgi:hypothetical protein
MNMDQVQYGQRVRVNMPGLGDHGQAGTVKKVRSGWCHVDLDWDHRQQHLVLFYPQDLELLPEETAGTQDRPAV